MTAWYSRARSSFSRRTNSSRDTLPVPLSATGDSATRCSAMVQLPPDVWAGAVISKRGASRLRAELPDRFEALADAVQPSEPLAQFLDAADHRQQRVHALVGVGVVAHFAH